MKTACNGVDLVIVCLGTGMTVHCACMCWGHMQSPSGSLVESEGNDRADINLPGSQLQLLQDAASVSKGGHKTISLLQ